MHNHYDDILSRIAEAPSWFDDSGVPRFGDFQPNRLGNIYAREAALAEIACQGCGRRFTVALSDRFARMDLSLGDEIRFGRVHYGDPPNIRCCEAGPSMNSVMHRILEYWIRDFEISIRWQRDPTFEGPVPKTAIDVPDMLAGVLAAIASGARAVRVMCTSRRRRYDLARRLTAAMASRGNVLLAHHEQYSTVGPDMLDGLLAKEDVGHWVEGRRVTLMGFSRLQGINLVPIDSVVTMAGPPPRNLDQEALQNAATALAVEARGKIHIELALAHSIGVIANPDLVLDAGPPPRREGNA